MWEINSFKTNSRELKDKGSLYYLNLEDIRLSGITIKDLQKIHENFLINVDTSKQIYIFYDEIQEVPEWERWVASFSDNSQVKVFITGSNSKLLSSELGTLLTGRHIPLHLTPFSFAEIATAKKFNIC